MIPPDAEHCQCNRSKPGGSHDRTVRDYHPNQLLPGDEPGTARHTILLRSVYPLRRRRDCCRALHLKLEIVPGGAVDERAVDYSDPSIRIPFLVSLLLVQRGVDISHPRDWADGLTDFERIAGALLLALKILLIGTLLVGH